VWSCVKLGRHTLASANQHCMPPGDCPLPPRRPHVSHLVGGGGADAPARRAETPPDGSAPTGWGGIHLNGRSQENKDNDLSF
jgi:hypothetical protein